MISKGYYHYFVEGSDDKKIVNTLKTDLRMILPGKVEEFNVVQKKLTKNRIMSLKAATTVILIFDADAGNVDILNDNIAFLNRQKNQIKKVICIPQVDNLEDELVRSCNIREIWELTKSKSIKDYKRDLLRIQNLADRLKECNFDINKFWVRQPDNQYKNIVNDAEKVKI